MPDLNVSSAAVPWAAGVILAGGRSQRMGGRDKALLPVAGKSLLAHVIDRLDGQVSPVVINTNGDPRRFEKFGLPTTSDTVAGFVGPLAGVLSGMQWARRQAPRTTHILSVAADTPFFPRDLAVRLAGAVTVSTKTVIAASRDRPHFVFGLWPIADAQLLENWLRTNEDRAVHAWIQHRSFRSVEFEGAGNDPFFNINTPADIEIAERSFAGSLR
jgi:molybdopterin-guanine dinucleotide biosynthesis protein A